MRLRQFKLSKWLNNDRNGSIRVPSAFRGGTECFRLLREETKDTKRPRSKENTHPSCISSVQNVLTPMRSRRKVDNPSKPTVREAEFLSGERRSSKAKASSRKTKEIHNLLDRVIPNSKGCRQRISKSPKTAVKKTNRGIS